MLPGEPAQEEDTDEQEEAAGCYLILHGEHERLRSCSYFCEVWEVCGKERWGDTYFMASLGLHEAGRKGASQ